MRFVVIATSAFFCIIHSLPVLAGGGNGAVSPGDDFTQTPVEYPEFSQEPASVNPFPVDLNQDSTVDSSAYETGVSSAPSYNEPSFTDNYYSSGSSASSASSTNAIQSLTGLGNTGTFGYSQSTSFTGTYPRGGVRNQCGFGAYAEINNANTALEQVYTTGVTWNSQKCVDEEKIAELEQEVDKLNLEANLQISKLKSQETIINQCLRERGQAVRAKTDPDSVCQVPDLRGITSILD